MSIIDNNLENFIKNIQKPFSSDIKSIQDYACNNNFPILKEETAKFLISIIQMKNPKKILEIGCCVGFSASIMGSFSSNDTYIHTIDKDENLSKIARENFKKLKLEKKITLFEGDALEILKNLNSSYDMIFLDGPKGQYINYLPYCTNLLDLKGILVADNVLQEGLVAKNFEDVKKSKRTIYKNMKDFLYKISNTNGLESSIIPIGDGISISTKLSSCIKF